VREWKSQNNLIDIYSLNADRFPFGLDAWHIRSIEVQKNLGCQVDFCGTHINSLDMTKNTMQPNQSPKSALLGFSFSLGLVISIFGAESV
jgi:hypothetical protein